MRKGKHHKQRLKGGQRQSKPHKTPLPTTGLSRPIRSKASALRKLKVLLLWPWNLVEVLAILLALTGLFYLLPRLDIVPSSDYQKADDPLATPLSLTNGGYLQIRTERVSSLIYDWRTASGRVMTGVTMAYIGGGTLNRGDTVDFTPSNLIPAIGTKIIKADFLVMVVYHQWAWPWRLEKRIRFKAIRDKDDRWIWSRPYLTTTDRKVQPRTAFNYGDNLEGREK